MRKKKPIKAIPVALLSLQFDRQCGNLTFTYTVNDGDLTDGCSVSDYYRFGRMFANVNNLSFLEKSGFAKFCRGFVENLKELP